MNTKFFLSDKYKVEMYNGSDFSNVPVYISLLSDGTQNNIKLPEEVYNEYDGLGMGTRTVKTYFSSFEFKDSVSVKITMPEVTAKVKVKPEDSCISHTFSNGIFMFQAWKTCSFYIEPDGDIFGGLHIFCNKAKAIKTDKRNIIEFTKGVHTACNCKYINTNEHGIPVINNIPDDTFIYIPDGAIVNAARACWL